MNILLLTNHLEIGGVGVYTANLAKGLAEKGHRVIVAASTGSLTSRIKREDIRFLEIDLRTKNEFSPKVFLSVRKLISAVRKFDIDIIHSQTRASQVAACIASRLARVPFVTTCHGFFKSQRLARRLFPCWGDRTIAISEAVHRQLTGDFNLPGDKVNLIHNGIDFEMFSKQPSDEEKRILKASIGIDEGDFVIGAIGRLSPVKGLRFLIMAMKDILKARAGGCLLLIGDGPSKNELIGLSEKLGINKQVNFIRSVKDTRPFLYIMDVFVFPSIQEGLGISLLEALAAGRACVATDVGGVSSIIKNDVTGLLIASEDSHAIRDAVLRILPDRGFAAKLGRNGMELVRDKFSLDEMTEKTLSVYESVMGRFSLS